jgi:hypothetical protein
MSRTRLALIVPAAALLLAGCSSAHKDVTALPTVKAPAVTASSTAPAPVAATTSAAPSDSGLSGSWTGQYSGAFSGTFKLNWQQADSKLTGKIRLSDPPSDVDIKGSVNGSTITFGTVGSTDITYSGTVSGNSMSGSYKVGTPTATVTGTWSATKDS